MKLSFFTPEAGVREDSFGAASFGFVGADDPSVAAVLDCPLQPNGIALWGSYEHILSHLPTEPVQAAIVLLGNAGGENDFVRTLSHQLQCPVTGGAAAMHPVTGARALLTGRSQAAVFLLQDEGLEAKVLCKNIHTPVSTHQIGFHDLRVVDTIDGQDALAWYNEKRRAYGLSDNDFEHLTFSDLHGINAHLSCVDGKLCAGRDLCPEMTLRYVAPEDVYDAMQDFYAAPDTLVFGCAGLKGILPKPLSEGAFGCFMFGEVCTMDGFSDFGNLMLSGLQWKKR